MVGLRARMDHSPSQLSGGEEDFSRRRTHALVVASTPGAQVIRIITGSLTHNFADVLSLSASSPPTPGTYTLVTANGGIVFGLIPNSGSSVNPFTSPFYKSTGQFTYNRRKPSLTGLTYSYQFTTDLGAWAHSRRRDPYPTLAVRWVSGRHFLFNADTHSALPKALVGQITVGLPL
jgi:hypothetical protein